MYIFHVEPRLYKSKVPASPNVENIPNVEEVYPNVIFKFM